MKVRLYSLLYGLSSCCGIWFIVAVALAIGLGVPLATRTESSTTREILHKVEVWCS